MILFADEGVDVPLVVALRSKRFHVLQALKFMQRADDEATLAEAAARSSVFLTKDKDFGEIVIRKKIKCRGVVLVSINDLRNAENIELVVELLCRYENEMQEHFTVIQTDKIRIRKLE